MKQSNCRFQNQRCQLTQIEKLRIPVEETEKKTSDVETMEGQAGWKKGILRERRSS